MTSLAVAPFRLQHERRDAVHAVLARFNGVRMQAFHDPARAQQWLREAAGFREID